MLQKMTEPESLGQVADDASDVNRQRISGSIRVSARQRGNPVLKHIRKVPWEFDEGIKMKWVFSRPFVFKLILVGLVADYILGASCVALYLSVRYHTLQPDYIHERLKTLGKGHRLRVLLVHVDVKVCYHFELLILHVIYSKFCPRYVYLYQSTFPFKNSPHNCKI